MVVGIVKVVQWLLINKTNNLLMATPALAKYTEFYKNTHTKSQTLILEFESLK